MLRHNHGPHHRGHSILLLGTVGSTIIRYFVPQRVLLKLLGDHSLKSYGAAMVSGFALPICDCAIIPYSRR